MIAVPDAFFKPRGFFAHVVILPLFVLGMLLLFCPFAFSGFLESYSNYSFHVTIIGCIILLVVVLVRIVLMILSGRVKMTWQQCLLSSFVELLASSGFSALYLWLVMDKESAYFWFFGKMFLYLLVLLAIPNIIIDLYYLLEAKNNIINNITQIGVGGKIRFLDERENVKLVINVNSLLYIQSDENYLKICYLDDNKITTYSLRNSMKRIEDLCAKNGLIRCHRSYYVNKTRIKVLQKEREFTYAILDVDNAPHIPVSRNYYEQVSSIL